jgi:phosphoglucosamine mutase
VTIARKLFGTDGVRGEAGTFLTAELATALGRATTETLEAERPQVLIVRDTRESGPMLEAALAAGIAAAGGDALLAGVLPTPAAAILVKRLGLDLAAVVSASHNPFGDNGIKFFNARGTKLADQVEAEIEARMDAAPASAEPGRVRELNGGLEDYLRELQANFQLDLSGRRVVLDCANGATFRAGPAIFERLGAEVETIGTEPDGRNINAGCGSTHVESLAERVAASEAEIGFAFDGDGDRVLAVDGAGRVHDGDELIALAARGMKARGELDGGGVVVTVMSNYGFHQAMKKAGIEVAITQVGDRYVIDEMLRRDWKLGGEQSGHIIASEFVSTGDGIAAALMTMRELGEAGLADAVPMSKIPQVLLNVKVADREAIKDAASVWEAVERENAALEGRGRVLLRPSGTEPLVRVMVEAPTDEEAETVCERLAALVRAQLA